MTARPRYRAADRLAWRQLRSEVVVLAAGRGDAVQVDSLSAWMLAAVDESPKPADELIRAAATEFSINIAEVAPAVESRLDELVRHGLIDVEDDSSPSEPFFRRESVKLQPDGAGQENP